MNETSWRSPFLGIGALATAFGLFVLFDSQGQLGFRAGSFAGGLLGSAVLAMPPFLIWRFALKKGRTQTVGAAFNVFVTLALTIWFVLFIVVKQTLPGLIQRTQGIEEKATLSAEGWTQENTESKELGPWLQYDPPGTRYCRYHDGTIQRLYPPGVKPNAEKANVFCLPGSTLSELGTESQSVDKSKWPVCKGMFDDLVPNAKCRPIQK